MDKLEKLDSKFNEYLRMYAKQREEKKAIEWLRKNVQKLVTNTSFTLAKKDKKAVPQSRILPGKFYIYLYDPKYKDTLPIWDGVPYVLVTSITNNGFYGINFHYLPPPLRVKFFAEIYKVASKTKIGGSKADKRTWLLANKLGSAIGANAQLSHCVKRYLYSHLMSKVMLVEKDDWALTSFLPLAQMHTKN